MGEVEQRENAKMWPTPTVHGNNNFRGASAKSGDGLMTVIKRREGYPTPTAKDANGPWHTTHSPSLNVVVCAKWPTPCAAGDLHYRHNGESQASKCLAVAVHPTPRALSLCGGSGSYRQIKSNPNLTDDEKRALIASAGRGAKYDTPTVHGDGGSGRKGTTPKYGQLNPDWEEWLMAWPVGWTDIKTPNVRLVWLDPSIDPADYGEIPRVTNRRDNRPARVKAIGNAQFPLTAAAAFHWGLCVLEEVKE